MMPTAIDLAAQSGVAISCAIVDAGGHLILLERMDGGRSDGEPGPRQAAMTTYYGAFIKDPDGNKIEAVTFPAV